MRNKKNKRASLITYQRISHSILAIYPINTQARFKLKTKMNIRLHTALQYIINAY